jgi:hypothetical protein
MRLELIDLLCAALSACRTGSYSRSMTPAMLCTDHGGGYCFQPIKVFEAAPRQAAVRRGPPQRQPARDRSASGSARRKTATQRARDRGRRVRGWRVSPRAAVIRRKKRGLTSERKITANRANARANTGPQTDQGRARAARNALRHALSLPVGSIPALSEEVETLAHEIAGPANVETQELAHQSPKRKSICTACVLRAINSCPIL